MASSSSTPLHIVDQDNDEFDWEAAVREIDVACAQTTTSSTNYCANNGSNHVINGKIPTYTSSNPRIQETHKKSVPNQSNFAYFSSSSRQLTLDRFIGIVPRNSNGHQREKHCNGFLKNKNNNFNSNCQINVGNSGEGQKGQAEDEEENAGFVKIDPEAAKTWIYPVNIPLRDYQFNITRTALFSNTLVALPTGLGKTLIAAVVMYNYFRWFPEGKIVFAAPSRPLVLQQIEACHNVVGIPQEWTIDLTGQTSPTRRADHWRSKRVFFVTPQVLEKDIYSGSCLVKHLVCLVVDEAHRATGNYSYCVAVRELMAVPVQLRVLALTATPGSKQQTIQHVIDNLQISRLDYRSESDPDVIPYVHDRKIELIEVAMGNDAVEINNLILEVIRPYVARLSAIGVLKNRDCQTLSPCDLLNSRDKFREAPPENLPHIKYGEVEGYFGVLITLYHIRKLLSSHGIKPAFEMLAEKLQQGSFARFMSRNEVLLKAKLLMQQSISHGAPSPKLSKLLEVLVDHFKMKDPLESRVIIFSNFRGSVRDIMNALKDIGEFVKATEFIGQTSGKALKGQSQKVQQAVLQKFRAGGYNVIVATSIGEEGLDIMEVDLVICFDANISPLRMIQRMGRTGRKHEGRVVVLACEGSELKGYMRKQANSKAIKKHMRNGGANSFQFHSSPRMIPHVFKPEVQFVELSIEQFVPRVKKVNDDDQPIQSPAYKAKLTDAENDLISKYFSTTRENTWKPSLIAFPHSQAFPSRVHKVLHSFRTGILIDAMQCLQGLSFSTCSTAVKVEDSASPEPCSASEALEQCNGKIKGMPEIQRDDSMVPDLVSTSMVHAQSVVKYLGKNDINVISSLTNDISAKQMKNSTPASKFRTPTVDECQSPFIKSPDIGFSKDWQLNPGGNSHGVKQRHKFKRLRKHGDLCMVKPQDCKEQTSGPTRNFTSSCVGADDGQNHHHRGKKFISNRAKVFVEDEAEVSLEVMVSSDEGDEQENNSYEDSFIDDRINPTAKSTQAEESGIDMMAVYRRSLLSQSPLVGVANFSEDFTPSSDVPRNERTSTSGSESHLVQKPENGLESTARNSASLHFNLDRVSSDALLSRDTTSPKEQKSKMENRKRKLFYKSGFLPVHNLEKEFFIGSVASGHDSMLHEQTDKIQENSKTFLDNDITENRNIFDDDQFYNAIDLDAIEEQAAKFLGFKTDYSKQNQVPIAEPVPVNPSLLGSPSFDLGI